MKGGCKQLQNPYLLNVSMELHNGLESLNNLSLLLADFMADSPYIAGIEEINICPVIKKAIVSLNESIKEVENVRDIVKEFL